MSYSDAEVARGAMLAKEALHGSLRDPVLDTMTFLNEITERHPEAVSFAAGRPSEAGFETADLFRYLRTYIDHLEASGATAAQVRTALFQYGHTAGQIRQLVADHLAAEEGVDVPAEAVVVTVGCQEAMLLVLRALFACPTDVLIVSAPCYVGITGAARLLDIPVVALPETDDAAIGDSLTRLVAAERGNGRTPRACYVVPDFSNPTGTTMSLAARESLLAAADAADVLIVEDNPYRLLTVGERLPTLKALDPRRRVVHLGSFAKTTMPGARVGFAVADQVVVDQAGGRSLLADELSKIKSMVTLNTPTLSQAAVAGMLLEADLLLSRANADAAARYAGNLARARQGLARAFPAAQRERLGVSWNDPTGGFFLTLRVPFPADDALLATSARDYGVIWTPMRYFQPGGDDHAIRLSVSSLTPAEIDEGIRRLTRLITARVAA